MIELKPEYRREGEKPNREVTLWLGDVDCDTWTEWRTRLPVDDTERACKERLDAWIAEEDALELNQVRSEGHVWTIGWEGGVKVARLREHTHLRVGSDFFTDQQAQARADAWFRDNEPRPMTDAELLEFESRWAQDNPRQTGESFTSHAARALRAVINAWLAREAGLPK